MKVIKSGEVVIGRCCIPAGTDSFGKELFVGDIVHFWHVENDNACWSSPSLSVIAECDSSNNLGVQPFAFGISSVTPLMPWDLDCDHEGFIGDDDKPLNGWVIQKAKHHEDCLIGERWDSFGFNYAEVEL
jgi:hypothetical protein